MLVWNINSLGPSTPLREFEGHEGTSIAKIIQDSDLVSNSEDGTIRIWDLDSGTCMHVLALNAASPWAECSAITEDGLMATSHKDGNINIWDIKKGCITGLQNS